MWFLGVCIVLFILLFIYVQKRGDKQPDNSSAKTPPQIRPEDFDAYISVSNQLTPSDSTKSQKRTLTEEKFSVAGVSYYLDNIGKLACQNPNWKKTAAQLISSGMAERRVFRYNYINKPVKLIPEPQNEHDENAVIVQIAGEKVGYISRSDNVHVKSILQTREIKYISSFISGGKYKIATEDKHLFHDEDRISISIRIAYI